MRPAAADSRDARYDGASAAELAAVLRLPRVDLYASVGSTMDEAHRAAGAGAPDGTLVLAGEQTRGRGRQGRTWSSPRDGVWLTMIARPAAPALDVLSLRVGLGVARALDAFAAEPIRLKWPNDLYVGDRKLAGILVEARWSGDTLDWIAIGLGINVREPSDRNDAAGLDGGTRRADVLEAVVPAVREAAEATGPLDSTELEEFAGRDLARGHACSAPVAGVVKGIAPTGELLVELSDTVVAVRSGSLVLDR